MATTLPMPIRAMLKRHALTSGILTGIAVALAGNLIPNPFAPLTRLLGAWDAGIVVYMVLLFWLLRNWTAEQLRAHADETDDGRHFVLAVSIAAVLISIAVIVFELNAAKTAGEGQTWRVGFVLVTVALTWAFVHASFASHYAHEYFGPRDDGGVIRGGLHFPGGEEPDFWDIVHFSYVIGVAAQTADIEITTKPLRRVVTVHGIVAFLINTVILAMTINFAAGLFQSH